MLLGSFSIAIAAAIVALDLIFNAPLTQTSFEWTISLQHSGGKAMQDAFDFFEGYPSYWMPLFLHIYMVLATQQSYLLYLVTLFALPTFTTMMLKAVYYRGRPFALEPRIEAACDCNPAMPSGHATYATLTYVILFLWGAQLLKKKQVSHRSWWQTLIGIFCFGMTATILFGMLALGQHTFMQIVIGLTVATLALFFLTFENFLALMLNMRRRVKFIAAFVYGCFLSYIVGMMFINHELRENYQAWVAIDKCPLCLRSFVYGQTDEMAQILFLPVYYFFFAFDSGTQAMPSRFNGNGNHQRPGEQTAIRQSAYQIGTRVGERVGSAEELTAEVNKPRGVVNPKKRQHLLRYLLLLGVSSPGIILMVVFKTTIHDAIIESHIGFYGKCLLTLAIVGTAVTYLGWATTAGKQYLFRKAGFLFESDSLHWNDLQTLRMNLRNLS